MTIQTQSCENADPPAPGRRGRLRRRPLRFYAAGLLIAFVSIEALCRLLLLNGWVNPVLYKLNRPSDSRNRLMWINSPSRGVRDGIDGRSVHDPELGWRTASNLAIEGGGKDLRVTTDANGFRVAPVKGRFSSVQRPRIVVLGDSFTFGDEVNDDETWPACLQQLLPGASVFNFGVVGYGHDQMLLQLKRHGDEYSPDIVILGFVCLDVWRNVLNFGSYAKPRFRAGEGGLELANVPVPPPEAMRKSEKYRLKVLDLFQIVWTQVHYSKALNQEASRVTARILDEMARTARSMKAVPIFVYLPDPHDMAVRERVCVGEGNFATVCGNVQQFSVRPAFVEKIRKGTRPASFFKYYHYSPAGNRAVAEAVRDYLLREGYYPGKPE